MLWLSYLEQLGIFENSVASTEVADVMTGHMKVLAVDECVATSREVTVDTGAVCPLLLFLDLSSLLLLLVVPLEWVDDFLNFLKCLRLPFKVERGTSESELIEFSTNTSPSDEVGLLGRFAFINFFKSFLFSLYLQKEIKQNLRYSKSMEK